MQSNHFFGPSSLSLVPSLTNILWFLLKRYRMESKNLDLPILYLSSNVFYHTGSIKVQFSSSGGHHAISIEQPYPGLLNALGGKDKRKARKHSTACSCPTDGNRNTGQSQLEGSKIWGMGSPVKA